MLLIPWHKKIENGMVISENKVSTTQRKINNKTMSKQ